MMASESQSRRRSEDLTKGMDLGAWKSMIQKSLLQEKRLELEQKFGKDTVNGIFLEAHRRMDRRQDPSSSAISLKEPKEESSAKETIHLLRPRLERVYGGSGGLICSVAFSPDNSKLITASSDGLAKVWDVHTGDLLFTLEGHNKAVMTAEFSLDGAWILTGSLDGSVRIYGASDGGYFWRVNFREGEVTSAHFSADSQHLVATSNGGEIQMWDVNRKKLLYDLQSRRGRLDIVSFSNSGKFFATASFKGTVDLWDVATGKHLKGWTAHDGNGMTLGFSADDHYLATAGDSIVKIWDLQSEKLVRTLKGHSEKIYNTKFSRDGLYLATGSKDGLVKIWSNKTGDFLMDLNEKTKWQVFDLEFSSDDDFIVIAEGVYAKLYTFSQTIPLL